MPAQKRGFEDGDDDDDPAENHRENGGHGEPPEAEGTCYLTIIPSLGT